MPKIRRKKRLLACSSLSRCCFEKLRTSRTRPKGLPWKLIIGRHIVNQSTSMEITEIQLHSIQRILFTRSLWTQHPTLGSHAPQPWSKRVICIEWQGFIATSCQRDQFQGNMRLLMGYFCEGNDRKINSDFMNLHFFFSFLRTRRLQSTAKLKGWDER